MNIIITGTPGTGKTTVAKKISKKLHLNHIDIKGFIAENKLITGFDKKRNCDIIDERLFAKKIGEFLKKNKDSIIDSHMSHYIKPGYADLCVVTKCDLKTLQKRLKKRGYSELKIKENLESEIFDVCFEEAKKLGHKPIIINTTKTTNKQLEEKVYKKFKQ